ENVCKELKATLLDSQITMIACRVFGHHPVALEIFQRAGFRLIIGNAWFYRSPGEPAPIVRLPAGIDLEFRDLRQNPVEGGELDKALGIAEESIFPDRFSRDLRIRHELARNRFLAITRNALSGLIARHASIAKMGSEVQAIVFFDMRESCTGGGYPIAGQWLTAIARRSFRAKGMSCALTGEAINRLQERKA